MFTTNQPSFANLETLKAAKLNIWLFCSLIITNRFHRCLSDRTIETWDFYAIVRVFVIDFSLDRFGSHTFLFIGYDYVWWRVDQQATVVVVVVSVKIVDHFKILTFLLSAPFCSAIRKPDLIAKIKVNSYRTTKINQLWKKNISIKYSFNKKRLFIEHDSRIFHLWTKMT